MSVMFSMQSNVDTAGIKADAKRAKEGGDKKVGVAWSHNFLNQKPWHPSNFRNQAKVFEAEQRAAQAAKSNAIAKVCHLETNRVHKGMRISGTCLAHAEAWDHSKLTLGSCKAPLWLL